MVPHGSTTSSQWVLRIGALAVAYFIFARIGLLAPQFGATIALMWPPAGIAVAALLHWGYRIAPGVWLGALMAMLSVGMPAGTAALIAAGNVLGPALGVAVLRKRGLHLALDRRHDLALLVGIGAGGAMLVTAINGTFWLAVSGEIGWVEAPKASMWWWLGDAMGVVTVGIPLLMISRTRAVQKLFDGRLNATTTGIAFSALVSSTASIAFVDNPFVMQSALLAVPHLLLGWLTVRSGLLAASSTALLTGTAAVFTSLGNFGPFNAGGDFLHGSMLVGYVVSLLAIPALTSALTSELVARERRLRLALDISKLGVGEWDLAKGRIVLSPRWLALLGNTSQELVTDIPGFWTQLHPNDISPAQEVIRSLNAASVGSVRVECRMFCKDGSWRWFELHTLVSKRNSRANPVRLISTARDISDVHTAREQRQLCATLLRNLHEGLLVTDPMQQVIEANPTYCEITGFSLGELLGSVPGILLPAVPDSEAAQKQAAMHACLATAGVWRGETVDIRRNGETCVLQMTVSLVRNDDSSVRNFLLAVTDITHVRQQLEQLHRQTHFDELTRLPNRVRLAQMLQTAMDTSRREDSLLTVCYLDLDHFKPVNDRFGQEAGDRLLLELANRMRRSLRSWAGGNDVVARIGGDEFVLLLRTATLEESRHAVERLLNQLCEPYDTGFGGETSLVVITASIGATVFPLDGADADTLLRHADHAMYGAKQAGRNGYLFFDAEHDRRAEARFVALGRVQEALDANEFVLHYQPKVDMQSVQVLGVEALLRWEHPEQGMVSPAQFLPLIENTALSTHVGNWVLQQGIDQLARWLRLGLDITVSVNVSARHLQEPLFAQHLAALLSRHDASVARHLIIEILETTALADVDYTCGLMEECRALGVRFALDDFGTGYSTFTYLKRLPVDMLKIDRSFVTNMLSDRQDLAIVEGVIGLSQTFGCSVVAEGVETREQAQRLIEIGCAIGQGNGIAAAMPADEVPAWVGRYCGVVGPQEKPAT